MVAREISGLGSLEMSRRPLSPCSLNTLAIFEEYAWICRSNGNPNLYFVYFRRA